MNTKIWGLIRTLILLFAYIVLVHSTLLADVTAVLLGTVRDSTGAAIVKAKVRAVNTATGFRVDGTSGTNGEFRIPALPIGNYNLEVEQPGFERYVLSGIVLNVNEERKVDVALQVGSIQQRVEVTANTIQVETASTQVGQVIDEKQILAMPLNGRSYTDLLALQAGVAPANVGGDSGLKVSGQLSAGNVSVNGQRQASNAFLVNGGDVSEGVNFGAEVIPNLDSIAEFRLITNSFDAEYGRFSGGVVNAITKSGSNSVHGSVFEFLRNNAMDARGFFDPTRGVLKRNQFGYAVGGPALKNKLFWFTDYQGTRQSQGASSGLVGVPSLDQRSGTFSPTDLSGTVNGPYWAQQLSQRLGYSVTNNEPYGFAGCASTSACVFPNGVIPNRAFSPISTKLLSYIPTPNNGSSYANSSQVATVVDDKAGQRVDFLTQSTGNWYVYYHFDDSTAATPSTLPGFSTTSPQRAQQAVLSNILTINPNTVSEARVNFTRMSISTAQPTDPTVSLSSLGFVTGVGTLGIINSGPANWQSVPPISLNNFSFGRTISNTGQYNNTWAASEALSWNHGSHAFKFGGEFRYFQVNERNVYAPNGNFTFDGSETGSDVADFLLGAPAQYIQASYQVLDSRTRYGGAYAQDSWRIRPNLTLNYGLRWEVSMPWYDTQNKIETIVPGQQSTVFPSAPLGWVFPGDKGIPSTLSPTRYGNFAPRVGIAWAPSASGGILGKLVGEGGKTSIRAAFGIYYTAIQDAGLFEEVADAPYGLYWVSQAPTLFDQPFVTRSDGSSQTQRFPFNLPVPGSPSLKNLDWSVFLPISGSPGYAPGNVLPYAEHFNLSIQRQIGTKTVASVAYVGTEGHHLYTHYEANPGSPALCLSLRGSGVAAGTTQCGPNQEGTIFTRPNGAQVFGTRQALGYDFGSNAYLATIANSNYNSLQASVERRAGDFTFLGAYTFSKSIDDSSAYGGRINYTNYRLSRALSSFDLTHNLVISYAYAVPFDRLFSALPHRLTQGWSLNGITRFASGFPITMSQSGDRSLNGTGGVDFPNYIGGLVVTSDPRTTSNHLYFNRSAFTSEVLGTTGNANPRFFHGPGLNNWDFSLQKNIPVRESMSFQIRGEFFNLMNHAQFNNPSGNYSSSTFGLITSAKPGRIGQVSAKFLW